MRHFRYETQYREANSENDGYFIKVYIGYSEFTVSKVDTSAGQPAPRQGLRLEQNLKMSLM
jgi:hypothetical protein